MAQRLRIVVHRQDACRRGAVAGLAQPRRGPVGRGVGARLRGHRDGKGEARALAGAVALGPDAPAMGLDEALADRKPQPGSLYAARAVAAGEARAPAEKLRDALRRNAAALVGNRDRDMDAVMRRLDPDGGRFRRMPGGVGEKVVQHLDDYARDRPSPGAGPAAGR